MIPSHFTSLIQASAMYCGPHVPAEHLIGVMVDGPEEPTPAVRLGVEPRGIGAPHLVDPAHTGTIITTRPRPVHEKEAPGHLGPQLLGT